VLVVFVQIVSTQPLASEGAWFTHDATRVGPVSVTQVHVVVDQPLPDVGPAAVQVEGSTPFVVATVVVQMDWMLDE
jgi:hypothetical protein